MPSNRLRQVTPSRMLLMPSLYLALIIATRYMLVFQLLCSSGCKGRSVLLLGSYLIVLASVTYLTSSEMIFIGGQSLSIFNLHCTIVYKAIIGLAPACINDLIIRSSLVTNRPGLHSASETMIVVPRQHTKFSERAFAVAGPSIWYRYIHSIYFHSMFVIHQLCLFYVRNVTYFFQNPYS